MDELIEELKARKYPQRQDSTFEQIRDLREVANALGMYDAADTLMDWMARDRYIAYIK